jgi:phosphoribosylamine-glycine ligase
MAQGNPIFGMTSSNRKYLHPFQIQKSTHPGTEWMTAGEYALVVTGVSERVSGAMENAYRRVKQLTIPGSPLYRNDIGRSQAEHLPKLQKMGYAMSWRY